jgi:ribosomal protein L28
MRKLVIPQKVCIRCGKGATIGNNKPHSLQRTKRVVKPNLQFYTDPESGLKFLLCTRCIRTING